MFNSYYKISSRNVALIVRLIVRWKGINHGQWMINLSD